MNEPSKVPTKKVPGFGQRRTRPVLVALVLAALLAVGAGVFFSGTFEEPTRSAGNTGTSSSAEQAGQPGDEPGSQEGATLDVPARGEEDAPVVMIEYADFQCPFCGKFARDVEPELVEKYVESGTLRIEWRDFPYLGQESVNAALAARAAQEQGKFWEYHDLLYENQGATGSGAFSDEKLVGFARELGLDTERFESDLTSGKYGQVVTQDLQEGQRRGIAGTPTFYINDEVLVGFQPIEAFEEAIEEAAREAEGD